MAFSPVNLVGGAYRDTSLPFSCQDTVNLIPEAAQIGGTRTVSKLRGAPGLKLFKTLGTGPIRGMRNVEGRLFVVSGKKLFEVSAKGDAKERGTIPGVGFVVMAHNQITMGNELLISNGSTGFVWNTRTEKLTRITDEGYPGAIAVDYIDSYLIQVEPFGRFWFHSDLADAQSYNTLDRGDSEYAPDKIVSLVVTNGEVVVLSETSIEFFANTGQATGTFQSKKIGVDVGCAGRHTVSKLDNTVFFLDNKGRVRRFNGYNPQIISTPPLEAEFNSRNMAQAFSFTYESEGHCIYYLSFPDGQTFGYDVTTNEWHRRESYGLKRWRVNELVHWQGDWIAGDFANGNLYYLDWATYTENGQPMVAERVTPVMHANQALLSAKYAEVIMDTGHGRSLLSTQVPAVMRMTPMAAGDWEPLGDGVVSVELGDAHMSLSDGYLSLGAVTIADGYSFVTLTPPSAGLINLTMSAQWLMNTYGVFIIGISSADGIQTFPNESSTPTSEYLPSVIEASARVTPDAPISISFSHGIPDAALDAQFYIQAQFIPDGGSVDPVDPVDPIKPVPLDILNDYKLMLDYSNDGGRNWSNRREKSLGKVGDYRKRLTFFGLGSFRTRVYRLRVSSNCKRDILGAVVELEGSDR